MDETVSQDDETTGFQIVAQVKGDVDELDNKTIYVKAVDSGDMYTPSTEVFIDAFEATMRVNGKLAVEAGVVEGTITVDICYDAACNQPMKGSPLLVPYKVTVLRGLVVETPAPTYSTPFGVTLADQQILVTLPEGVTDWTVADDPSNDLNLGTVATATATAGADADHGVVNFRFAAKALGTYNASYLVNASTPNGEFQKRIDLTYTVGSNASIDYWFSPERIDITRVYGDDAAGHAHGFTLLGNTGIELTIEGFEYLSEPVEAQGHLLHDNWWSRQLQSETSCMYDDNNQLQCLPVGTYTARYRISYVKGGQTLYAYLPVVMTITP